jgi:hypothetical protein
MGGEGGQPRGEGKGRPSVGGGRKGGGQEGPHGHRAPARVSLRAPPPAPRGATKKGNRGKGPPLGFLCGRNETTPQMTLT